MENMSESLMEELKKIRAEEAAAKAAPANNEQEVPNTDTNNAETAKAETAKAETANTEPAKGENSESNKPETDNSETNKSETNKSETGKTEPSVKSLKELIEEAEAAEARQRKLKDIEELENDEFVKLVLETKKNGGDVKRLLTELVDVNPDKLTEEELYYMTLPAEMDADEKREEYEKFEVLNERFRKSVIDQQREKIKQAQSEKLTALMGKGERPDVRPAFNNATVGLDAALEKLQGKEFKGIELTPARLLELRKEAIRFFGTFMDTAKNEIDYQEALETAFARKAVTAWSDEIKKSGVNQGKIEAFKEIHNPSAMRSVGTATNKGQRDSQAEIDAAWAKLNNASTTIR